MIPPHTNRYPKPPSGAATGWGRFFLLGRESGVGRLRRGQDRSLRGKRYMGGNGKVEGRACPAPTDCCENLRTRGAREGDSPPLCRGRGLPFPVHRLFHAVPNPMTLAQNAAASASMGKPSPSRSVCQPSRLTQSPLPRRSPAGHTGSQTARRRPSRSPRCARPRARRQDRRPGGPSPGP